MKFILALTVLVSACGTSPLAPTPVEEVRTPDPDPDPNAILPRARNGRTICPPDIRGTHCDFRH